MIARDLSAFVDPGTHPSFEADGNMLRVEWQVQGKTRDAMFTLKAGSRLRWASGPSGDDHYYQFLASEEMAGFKQVARSSLARIEQHSDYVAMQDRKSVA